jgi:hypothetical protein
MQCNYKFFLSFQASAFEENGVNIVEKAINQVKNFKEEGCNIHFMNLSSNVSLDKVR